MKRVLSVVLSLAMLLSLACFVSAKEQPSAWAADEVNAAISSGLVPDAVQQNYTKGISRADLSKILSKLLDMVYGKAPNSSSEKFTDTTDSDVLNAANLGIINGYKQDNGTYMFKPNNTLKRCEMAAIVNRVAKLCGKTTTGYDSLVTFADTANHWCKSELGWPVHAGIVKGTSDSTFSPENTLTTEQTIMMIYRLYKELGGKETPKTPDSGTTTSGVRAEVKKIIDEWEAAWNEYYDALENNSFLKLYAAAEKADKAASDLDSYTLNTEEDFYFLDAYNRVLKRANKAVEDPTKEADKGIRSEVKDAIDAYEKAYNEYCDCMLKYQKSNNYTDLLTALGKLDAATKATANLDTTSFNSDEQDYYWDAYYRIMKRLAEIGE